MAQDRSQTCGSALTRRQAIFGGALALPVALSAGQAGAAAGRYAWSDGAAAQTLESSFPPPPGFERTREEAPSFVAWLRGLPMKTAGAPVRLYTGADKPRQDVHAGIIDIDVGARDLQQCADAVMRLRAEWLFSTGQTDRIAFNVTEGPRVPFSRWARGERPSPSGRSWKKSASADSSYESFRKFMTYIFTYAGTASLEKELVAVKEGDMRAGDVVIHGGFPGHAVLVADSVENVTTGARRFLLVQSYMPAQDIHVLKNFQNGDGSPWYGEPLGAFVTPEWTFPAHSVRRWP